MGWAEFLAPVASAVRNPPTRGDFTARVGVINLALSDIPAGMLTAELQRQAVRRFEFWPSVAELGAWLGPMAMQARAQRNAIGYEPPTPPRERTTAEREHAAAAARAFAAEMGALNRPRVASPTSASHAAPEHLLAAYEEFAREHPGLEGGASRMRAASLRAKLEANKP